MTIFPELDRSVNDQSQDWEKWLESLLVDNGARACVSRQLVVDEKQAMKRTQLDDDCERLLLPDIGRI